jgi:hypothetical protein
MMQRRAACLSGDSIMPETPKTELELLQQIADTLTGLNKNVVALTKTVMDEVQRQNLARRGTKPATRRSIQK